MKRLLKKLLFICLNLGIICCILLSPIQVHAASFYYPPDKDGKLVIVLDPGHGGSNSGAMPEGFVEKEMNLKVAKAMAAELRKYEGVTVYLTREDNQVDVSIQERADFASSVQADFLFCLHFNMSESHSWYGAEAWISAFGDENRQGYGFSQVWVKEMETLGLFNRGIKTRLGEEKTDYYGIIRFCEEYGIPTALMEHCFMDHENDAGHFETDEALVALGKSDATAVAKFFGLKSTELGVDYSDNPYIGIAPVAGNYCIEDTTEPDFCMIEKGEADYANSSMGIKVTACDYDSPLLYYAYSVDGGENYTPYLPWPEADMIKGTYQDTFVLDIPVVPGTSPIVKFRTVNQYGYMLESETLQGLPVFPIDYEPPMADSETGAGQNTDGSDANSEDTEKNSLIPEIPDAEDSMKNPNEGKVDVDVSEESDYSNFLTICFIVAASVFFIILMLNLIFTLKKTQKRHSKKK